MSILNKNILVGMLVLSIWAGNGYAQKLDSSKTVPAKLTPKDTTRKKGFPKPTNMRVGLDLIGIGQLAFANKNAIHFTSDISFKNKHLWVFEYTLAHNKTQQKATYDAQASIIRLGWVHNFLHKQSGDDVFGLGLRLGNAWYVENIKAEAQSAIFGSSQVELQNKLGATWIEINMEFKARIWRKLLTGYSARYQFKPFGLRGNETFASYSIPSVGRLGKNNWGFQYCIWYLIDFEKKKKS